jgi:sec-independent protein translocase protein TatA
MGIENPIHLLFLGAVALLVLGPKRLPELAKALGNGIREFRESISDGEDGEQPASPNGSATAAAAATAPAPAPNGTPTAPAQLPAPEQAAAPEQPPAAGGSAPAAPGEEEPG